MKVKLCNQPVTELQPGAPVAATIQKYLAAEKRLEEAKKIYEEYDVAVAALADEAGGLGLIGSAFQEPDGTVHKLVVPSGAFVHFKHIGVVRTKRSGEERGSLSVKEASALGF